MTIPHHSPPQVSTLNIILKGVAQLLVMEWDGLLAELMERHLQRYW